MIANEKPHAGHLQSIEEEDTGKSDQLKKLRYRCERWQEDCRRAEQEAASCRAEIVELKQTCAKMEQRHFIEIEALKRHYESTISELVNGDRQNPRPDPRVTSKNEGDRMDAKSLSDDQDDLKGIFAAIQSTTLKIEKLLGVSPPVEVHDVEMQPSMPQDDSPLPLEEPSLAEQEKQEKQVEKEIVNDDSVNEISMQPEATDSSSLILAQMSIPNMRVETADGESEWQNELMSMINNI